MTNGSIFGGGVLGLGVLVGVLACGGSDGPSSGGAGAAPGTGGAPFMGGATGGVASAPGPAGTGGASGSGPGGGGTTSVGAGGVVTTTGGATGIGTGGETSVGSGGTTSVGSGGTAGSAAGGTTGATTLAHCDMTTESSAAPITQACGDITTPTGTNVKLGALGASMDVNVGVGFENTDPADSATCPSFVGLFKEAANVSTQLLDVGAQPCSASTPNTGSCLNFKLYSVYRPATWPDGKIPVLSWGNGTCAQPEGYGTLLRYIASQGFFVVAANSREVGSGAEIKHAIDFAEAANKDPSSPYFGHLDLTKVGVMGHSQGSQGAAAAASDARVKSAILFNAGTSAVKPYLAITGDLDIVTTTPAALQTAADGQPQGAFLFYHNPAGNTADGWRGHLVLMLTPERVAPAATGFWQMTLNGDATAKNLFVGSTCGLCSHSSDYEYGEHGF